MKLLVLCNQYPTEQSYSQGTFFHIRNIYYQNHGCDVTVVSFIANSTYVIDDIHVYTKSCFLEQHKIYEFDLIVCHAPHYATSIHFLNKYNVTKIPVVFFFHGNEVFDTLKINPYQFMYDYKHKLMRFLIIKIKDYIKLRLVKRELMRIGGDYVFVSDWMKKTALKHLNIQDEYFESHCHVINNAVGTPFENGRYDFSSPKRYDFICIRGFYDGTKYGIDLVEQLANLNPHYTFLIIGKGNYFNDRIIPQNITLLHESLNHKQIIDYLMKSRCALLLTRWDSQGLMTCEAATFGIPTITSDIEVCHEMLDSFSNVVYINNEDLEGVDLAALLEKLESAPVLEKNRTFFAENTENKEILLFNKIMVKNDEK